MRYKTIALDVVAPVVELLTMLALAWFGARTLGLSLAYTVSSAVAAALLVHFTRIDLKPARAEAVKPESRPHRALLGPTTRFGFSVWIVEILMEFSRRASILMLGIYESSAVVGIFGIVQRLVGLGGIFLLSTNLMFSPYGS